MIDRLGDVLYWTGCILAALVGAGSLFVFWDNPQRAEGLLLSSTIALGVWLIGRALKYVLAGR